MQLLFAVISSSCLVIVLAQNVDVNTRMGIVIGSRVDYNDKGNSPRMSGKADDFLEIPFVQPPIGNLRFQDDCQSGDCYWSDWVDVGGVQPDDGQAICGMCYTQNQTRQCLSQSNGCECTGPSTQIIHTSDLLCTYPRATCCDGYAKKLDVDKKKYTCQPNTTLPSTPLPNGCSTASSNTAPTTIASNTETTKITTTTPCVDSDTKNCAAWVANGFCTNPSYTDEQKKQYCASSCNLCDGCKDADTSCSAWRSNGFCENPGYTDDQKREYCAKSCNLCGETTPTGTLTVVPCIDASASCPTWVMNGFCSNPAYSVDDKKKFCAKSCNLC